MTEDRTHDTAAAVRTVVAASLDQVAGVRQLIRAAVAASGDDRSVADDLALAASELGTNVVQYAATDEFSVSCVRNETLWILEVSNADGVDLGLRAGGSPSPMGGRGLMIVRALMDTVELVDRPGGSSIRCTVARR